MDHKKFSYTDLLLILILTILCALFFYTPILNETIVKSILGLLLIVFIPGYVVIAFLFPRKSDLSTIERLALTVILSMTITVLTGMVLNYTPWGIHVITILTPLVVITLVLCVATFWRRSRIPYEEHLRLDLGNFFRRMKLGFFQESKTGKILSVIVAISIVLALSSTAYVIVMPKQNESYSQFYILGPDGKINNFPTTMSPGQEGNLIIGVVNNENKQKSYRLFVTSNGEVLFDEVFTLNGKQKMEIPFNFTAGDPGIRKMEFFLYKLPDNANTYRYLYLWINVTG
jgi:uncharacterized membrane protein